MNGMRIWTLVTVLLIGAILGLGWLLGLSPLLAQAAASDAERVNVELTNTAQEATLALMKSQHDEIDSLRDDLDELSTSIPSQVDTDTVYELLAAYQAASGATPSFISLGEAVQYGIPVEGPETTAADAPASGSAPQGALADTLYTVPVTISFGATGLDQVMAFVAALQHGPRLFLVTSVTTSPDSASITAYLFVIYDGTTPQVVEAPDAVVPEPTPTPAPGGTETPVPTGSPTPTPTP
jgi:hypothetical protein